MSPEPEQVTQILDAVRAGDSQAAAQLLPLVFQELRKLAAQKMTHEAPGQTLHSAVLVRVPFCARLFTCPPIYFPNRSLSSTLQANVVFTAAFLVVCFVV
jgi:hypothetical protein